MVWRVAFGNNQLGSGLSRYFSIYGRRKRVFVIVSLCFARSDYFLLKDGESTEGKVSRGFETMTSFPGVSLSAMQLVVIVRQRVE